MWWPNVALAGIFRITHQITFSMQNHCQDGVFVELMKKKKEKNKDRKKQTLSNKYILLFVVNYSFLPRVIHQFYFPVNTVNFIFLCLVSSLKTIPKASIKQCWYSLFIVTVEAIQFWDIGNLNQYKLLKPVIIDEPLGCFDCKLQCLNAYT